MHVTYEPNLCKTELMQGDVLARTPELNEVLRTVHPHFQDAKNQFFLVLTQSCDLVLRGEHCKTPYISLAPVRSLDLVIERQLAQLPSADVKAELLVLGDKAKTKASEFLNRLLNNNESSYFYLDSEDTPLNTDSVAFLKLSIAVKSDLHFGTCSKAKILQLESTFQAKLGWLVGQMYSRVGTTDWESAKLSKKISQVLKEAAIWIEDSKVSPLEQVFKANALANPDAKMSQQEIQRVISQVPSKRKRVMAEATRVVHEALGAEHPQLSELLQKRLERDEGLGALLR